MVLVADEDGVSGIEGEFVFAGKSTASGNAETDAVGDGGGSVG